MSLSSSSSFRSVLYFRICIPITTIYILALVTSRVTSFHFSEQLYLLCFDLMMRWKDRGGCLPLWPGEQWVYGIIGIRTITYEGLEAHRKTKQRREWTYFILNLVSGAQWTPNQCVFSEQLQGDCSLQDWIGPDRFQDSLPCIQWASRGSGFQGPHFVIFPSVSQEQKNVCVCPHLLYHMPSLWAEHDIFLLDGIFGNIITIHYSKNSNSNF